MTMVFIRIVCMPMPQRLMRVCMRMRFGAGIVLVQVLMMAVVHVQMFVSHLPVRMIVIVAFG